MLPAAVKQGHNHVYPVGLAAYRLDKPLEILEMVVWGHAVFLAEQLISAAIVSHVHNKEQVIAPHSALNNPLAVAGGEPGTTARDAEGFRFAPGLLRPAGQMGLYFVRTLRGPFQGNNP